MLVMAAQHGNVFSITELNWYLVLHLQSIWLICFTHLIKVRKK